MKKVIAVLGMLAASACGVPTLDITAANATADVKSSVSNARIGQFTRHTLRSYAMINGTRTEVAGARCSIRSQEISVEQMTPGTIIVPSFIQRDTIANRGKPSPLTITCTNGEMIGSLVVDPEPIGRASTGGMVGQPTQMVSQISGGQAGSSPWGYPAFIKIDLTQ